MAAPDLPMAVPRPSPLPAVSHGAHKRNNADDAVLPSAAQETTMVVASNANVDVVAVNKQVGHADILLKMVMMSSSIAPLEQAGKWRGKDVCDSFNDLLSRIASNEVFQGGECNLTTDDVACVRDMATACYSVLGSALKRPADVVSMSDDGKPVYNYRLTVGMVDLLRTACFQWSDKCEREYSKECKSVEAQTRSPTCLLMRDSRYDSFKECYACGDQMSKNMDAGLEIIRQLASSDDLHILSILTESSNDVSKALRVMLLPALLDGRRMKASAAICARMYDFSSSEVNSRVLGSESLLSLIFDSNASNAAVHRLVKTIICVMAMARGRIIQHHCAVASRAGKEERQGREDAHNSSEWECMSQVLYALSTICHNCLPLTPNEGQCKSPPRCANEIFKYIADWFEDACNNADLFGVLSSAFDYAGFVPGIMHPRLKAVWDDFASQVPDQKEFTVWEISSFLVSARLQLHNSSLCGTNVVMTSIMCFSSAVTGIVAPNAAGPIMFSPHITKYVNKFFADCFGKTTIQKAKMECGGKPKVSLGKTVKTTTITRNISEQYMVRKQHDKSVLMDTRLAACFFMVSIAEELNKDLTSDVAGLPACKGFTSHNLDEGRKQQYRLYVVGLQATPCVGYTRFRNSNASHLIEKSRKSPQNTRSTPDNTEKPFRDIVGGAIISTILYSVAGRSFMNTIEQLILECERAGIKNPDDEDDIHWFKSHSNTAVNIFISHMRQGARRAFKPETLDRHEPGPVKVGTNQAKIMMLQQLSFINKFCDAIKDNGVLWEDMQLAFSIQSQTKPQEEVDEEDKRCAMRMEAEQPASTGAFVDPSDKTDEDGFVNLFDTSKGHDDEFEDEEFEDEEYEDDEFEDDEFEDGEFENNNKRQRL